MQLNDLDRTRLHRLAGLRPSGAKVLSVYVDLDPANFGTQPARASQFASVIDEAERGARAKDLPHEERMALRKDVTRVRDFLRTDFSAGGAHGVALFACGPEELFEVIRLPAPTERAVVIDDTAWIDPLVGRTRQRRAFALVNRRIMRVFADGRTGALSEIVDLRDDVHGQQSTGGWSQARFARSVEDDVLHHVKRSARRLAELNRRDPFDVLAIGTSQELWPDVERQFAADLRPCCLGRFDVADVEHANADDVLAAARPLLDAAEDERIGALLTRLTAGLARDDGHAAAGFAPVLAALDERRVETLLYESGFRAPDDGETALDDAIAAALMQRADVVALRDRPELGPLGGIAALLRF